MTQKIKLGYNVVRFDSPDEMAEWLTDAGSRLIEQADSGWFIKPETTWQADKLYCLILVNSQHYFALKPEDYHKEFKI